MKTKVLFGKYKGHTVDYIINHDLQYITWCLHNIKGFKLTTTEEKRYKECKREKEKKEYYNSFHKCRHSIFNPGTAMLETMFSRALNPKG